MNGQVTFSPLPVWHTVDSFTAKPLFHYLWVGKGRDSCMLLLQLIDGDKSIKFNYWGNLPPHKMMPSSTWRCMCDVDFSPIFTNNLFRTCGVSSQLQSDIFQGEVFTVIAHWIPSTATSEVFIGQGFPAFIKQADIFPVGLCATKF